MLYEPMNLLFSIYVHMWKSSTIEPHPLAADPIHFGKIHGSRDPTVPQWSDNSIPVFFEPKEIYEMKTLLMILVVVVVSLVAFNYLTTGELKLLPGDSMSEAGHEVNSLRGEFRAAAREYRQAGKAVAASGMDTSDAAAAALAEVDRVEIQVDKIARTTTEPEVKADADKLLKEIAQYKMDVGS